MAFQTWYYFCTSCSTLTIHTPSLAQMLPATVIADWVFFCLQEVLQELNYDEEVNNIRYCCKILPFAACFHPWNEPQEMHLEVCEPRHTAVSNRCDNLA